MLSRGRISALASIIFLTEIPDVKFRDLLIGNSRRGRGQQALRRGCLGKGDYVAY